MLIVFDLVSVPLPWVCEGLVCTERDRAFTELFPGLETLPRLRDWIEPFDPLPDLPALPDELKRLPVFRRERLTAERELLDFELPLTRLLSVFFDGRKSLAERNLDEVEIELFPLVVCLLFDEEYFEVELRDRVDDFPDVLLLLAGLLKTPELLLTALRERTVGVFFEGELLLRGCIVLRFELLDFGGAE